MGSDLTDDEDQPRVVDIIFNQLNMGLVLILVSFYLADSFVSSHLAACLYAPLTTHFSTCYFDIPIGYIVATSIVAFVGVRLVIENTVSDEKLEILGYLGFALVILYPAITGFRILDHIAICQGQSRFTTYCFRDGIEAYTGHVVISVVAVSLGIMCYAVFFHRNRKLLDSEDEFEDE